MKNPSGSSLLREPLDLFLILSIIERIIFSLVILYNRILNGIKIMNGMVQEKLMTLLIKPKTKKIEPFHDDNNMNSSVDNWYST